MKHYSGIDYEHFLDDIRDMYPFNIEEAILVELIANSLDAKTTLLDIRIDPDRKTFQLVDNGSGMDVRGFDNYHNFSTSFKRKGQGIGFAGLGAKLSLRIAERVITESRSTKTWRASEWRFERKRRSSLPVWFDLDERTLPHNGTSVRMELKGRSHLLLDPSLVRTAILAHYLPLIALNEFYESMRLYRRVTVLVNGEVLEPAWPVPAKSKQIVFRRGKGRIPFALARFELHAQPLSEGEQGVAIATYGKIIRRDPLKQYFTMMDRITGIIEVPELVECLTTNKCDFRKDGAAGYKYYRFSKMAQQEFRGWLEELQLLEKKEIGADRDVRRLQRVVNSIVGNIPDLQQFFGGRSERIGLVRDADGSLLGARPEHPQRPESDTAPHKLVDGMREPLEEAPRREQALQPSGENAADRRASHANFGPLIRHHDAPDRDAMSWMEGDTIYINTAHPAYGKAAERKFLEYHELLTIALAMVREVPTSQERIDLLEQFMIRWGKV
jgi:hypothetical protein